jgi:hypothetical protein
MCTRTRTIRSVSLCLAIAVALLSGCGGNGSATKAQKQNPDKLTPAEFQATVEEGYIYGLPIVMNYAVMYEYCVDKQSGEYRGPFNQIASVARVFTPKDTTVIAPNSDTPYSFLWLDLRAEPQVLSVPAVEKGRYYSVLLCDGNTFNYGYIGTRATGNDAGDYLVAGPDFNGEAPAGVKKVFRSSTQFSAAIYRTQLFSEQDMPNVAKVQSGYHARPLSAYLHRPPPRPAPAVNFPKINKALLEERFFDYLDLALRFAPAEPEEKEIRAKLARIGVGTGKAFDFRQLAVEHRAEVAAGMDKSERKVADKAEHLAREINGWQVGAAFGDRDYYHGDWLLRAAAARAGIYGNDAAEAMYPMTGSDSAGQPLDGGRHDYTFTFAAGQLPPVNAFWSVTMYDGNSQLYVENPINRYLVNSAMLPGMKKGADGSLTIYIQKDSPGNEKESNWLPAPDGPIYLVMRLYWPKETPPSILPPREGTWQPPGVVQAK